MLAYHRPCRWPAVGPPSREQLCGDTHITNLRFLLRLFVSICCHFSLLRALFCFHLRQDTAADTAVSVLALLILSIHSDHPLCQHLSACPCQPRTGYQTSRDTSTGPAPVAETSQSQACLCFTQSYRKERLGLYPPLPMSHLTILLQVTCGTMCSSPLGISKHHERAIFERPSSSL